MAVSNYTENYNLPLFLLGTGGEDSADNGLKEWLDAEMFAARNLITKNGNVVVKNGDVVYKST
ncbi:hypothetical protein KAR91_73445 [Candidatus Pacearchaeota archaeon]|nr:hypothetical protein [Candidatus Pacearchaeota archaeon]